MYGWAGMIDILQDLKSFKCPEEWGIDAIIWRSAKEIERLREALSEIASGKLSHTITIELPPLDLAVNRAKTALERK